SHDVDAIHSPGAGRPPRGVHRGSLGRVLHRPAAGRRRSHAREHGPAGDRGNSSRMKPTPAIRRRVPKMLKALAALYPDAHCALEHQTPLQLLIATILSAQCTDVRVNMVTPALFARYKTAQNFADADPKQLEGMIASTGFFRNKAKNIIACCKAIVAEHGGEV